MKVSVVKVPKHTQEKARHELEKPSKKEIWGYGVGSLGLNSSFTLTSSFLTYYYTDSAGITAGAVGTLMLIARLFDGITDLGMGTVVDKTKTKYGKARPWILWMSLPLGLAILSLFTVPDISNSGKLMYAYVTYLAFILLYTMVAIPYKTLLALMTQEQHSRSLSNLNSAIWFMFGTLIVMTLTQPVAANFGWTTLANAYAIVTVIPLLITFRTVKERITSPLGEENNIPLKRGLLALAKNQYWFLITIVSVLFYIILSLVQGGGLYYARWVLGNEDLFPFIGLALTGPMVLGLFFMGPLVKRFGKKNVMIFGWFVALIGQCIKMIDMYDLPTFLIGSSLAGLGAMPSLGLMVAMLNDTVEYGEYKTGVRTEGLLNSGASFGGKVGTGLGLAIIGWLLSYGGYVGQASEQNELAITMIKYINIHLPIVFGLSLVTLLFFFKVEKMYPEIIAELQRRKNGIK
ncbi:MFS transporter [Pueribacillus sp. YX66]|uniref:MFS transporter n=1 Tax=Pueribacillus sp. YX66 TaxID=3229242 RepID=UPI00358D80D8